MCVTFSLRVLVLITSKLCLFIAENAISAD